MIVFVVQTMNCENKEFRLEMSERLRLRDADSDDGEHSEPEAEHADGEGGDRQEGDDVPPILSEYADTDEVGFFPD